MEETFGKRLTRLRERIGVTKAELARMANITRTAVGMYEERATADKCQVQHLKSLCRILGVSMDYLCYGKEHQSPLPDAVILNKALLKYLQYFPQAKHRGTNYPGRVLGYIYSLYYEGIEPTPALLTAFLTE